MLRRLIVWDIARWTNADRAVDRVYRLIGWLAFTRVGATILVGFGLLGLVLWFEQTRSPIHQLVTLNGSYVLGLIALTLLQVLSISVHEAGHALAIRHFGRHVRRFGVAMYYLFPCFYVDSTDMSLGSRRQRVIVSLAGPFAGLTVAAACSLVTELAPNTLAGAIAFKASSLLVFQFVLNLLPILELDGYHVLVDALDAPFLRQRALAFVRGQAVNKLRRRARWSREEVGLAVFGSVAIFISLATLVRGRSFSPPGVLVIGSIWSVRAVSEPSLRTVRSSARSSREKVSASSHSSIRRSARPRSRRSNQSSSGRSVEVISTGG